MKQPFEECPKFNTCSVNRCPLHPDYLQLESIPADLGRKCRLSKMKRIAIASRFPGIITFGGFTIREHSMSQNALNGKKITLNPHIQQVEAKQMYLPIFEIESNFPGGAA